MGEKDHNGFHRDDKLMKHQKLIVFGAVGMGVVAENSHPFVIPCECVGSC